MKVIRVVRCDHSGVGHLAQLNPREAPERGPLLRYATVGVAGRPTSATGLVALPRTARRLPTVSYAHGTMAARADAPSASLDSLAGASVMLFASAGFPTVAPDYPGPRHGSRPTSVHARGQRGHGIAGHAARRPDVRGRVPPAAAQRTLVTGFSQGAHAAYRVAAGNATWIWRLVASTRRSAAEQIADGVAEAAAFAVRRDWSFAGLDDDRSLPVQLELEHLA